MHFLQIFAASLAIVPTVLSQFSGYYNISSALPITTKYLTYNDVTQKLDSSDRNERFQQWYITSEPSGYAFIANRFVPQPLVITASTGSNPNTDLQQAQVLNFEPNAISSQAWKITRLADGYYEIESMRYPGLVLDVKGSSSASGEKVLVYPRNNPQTPNQKWRLSKPTIDTLANYGW